jgi:hypothetical protein
VTELWDNPLFPPDERLEMAKGGVIFRDKVIDNLRGQLEAAKKDAERWRTEMTLRNDPAVAIMFVGTHNRCSIFRHGELLASGETYAEAIDAARAASGVDHG